MLILVKKRVWGDEWIMWRRKRHSVEGYFSEGDRGEWVRGFQEKSESIYNLLRVWGGLGFGF